MSRRGLPASGAALAVWLLLQPSAASASPPFELAGSALAAGGFNARASGADASSSYFNPARLALARQGLDLGWFVLNDAISLTLYARDPVVDVPELALGEFEGRFPPLPTRWLEDGCDPIAGGECVTALPPRPRQGAGSSGETRVYQIVGLVAKVHERYLTLGVYGMLPLGSFLEGRSFFVDEREQYFTNSLHPELYSDRLSAMSLAFGAGSRLLDWLAFGVGVTLSVTNAAEAGTYVGDSGHISETLRLSTHVEVSTGVSPHFGVLVQPLERLGINLTVHTPQRIEIMTSFSTFLPNGDLQRADRTATLAWMPWTIGAGAEYELVRTPEHRLGLVATAAYRRWSDYVDRQSERARPGYGWSDTPRLGLGVRHSFAGRLASALDLDYEPSPVPHQSGRTNYVDNDRVGIGAGVSYELPLWSSGLAFRIGVQGQVHILPKRAQLKLDPTSPRFSGADHPELVVDEWVDGAVDNRDVVFEESFGLQTNNPGWPGFSSDGVIWGGGVTLSLLY